MSSSHPAVEAKLDARVRKVPLNDVITKFEERCPDMLLPDFAVLFDAYTKLSDFDQAAFQSRYSKAQFHTRPLVNVHAEDEAASVNEAKRVFVILKEHVEALLTCVGQIGGTSEDAASCLRCIEEIHSWMEDLRHAFADMTVRYPDTPGSEELEIIEDYLADLVKQLQQRIPDGWNVYDAVDSTLRLIVDFIKIVTNP